MTNFIKHNTKTVIMNGATNRILLIFIFAAILSYVYFANITVRTLTILEKTKKQMQSLSIEVSEMESQRLSIENNINEGKALQMGFIEVNNPIFITRKTAALSFKTE